MKSKWFFLFFFIGFSFSTFAQSVTNELCEIENTRFENGETLIYRVYYNWGFVWVPAGEVRFSLKENCEDYEVTVHGKTFNSYNNFFEVDDYFYSKMDRDSLYPKQFVRRIQEGGYMKYDSINFLHETGLAEGILGKTRDQAQPYSLAIDPCVHDIISVLYHVRNLDFNHIAKGKVIPTSVFFDKESFYPNLEFGGTENKKIKKWGKVKAHKLIPELVAGEVFNDDSRMKIWVSNDQNQLPILIESPVSIGSVKAILWDHKGLRYPTDLQRSK